MLGSAKDEWFFITPDDKFYRWTGAEGGSGFIEGSQLTNPPPILAKLAQQYERASLYETLWSSQLGENFSGRLAHFRHYNRPLAASELRQAMHEDQVATASFRAHYPFDFDLLGDQKQRALYIMETTIGANLNVEFVNQSQQEIRLDPAALEPAGGEPSTANHHFELRFRPGTLSPESLGSVKKVLDTPADVQERFGIRTAALPIAQHEDDDLFSAPLPVSAAVSNGTVSNRAVGGIRLTNGGPWRMSAPTINTDETVSFFLLNQSQDDEPRTLQPGDKLEFLLENVSADGTGGARGTRVELRYQQMRYAGDDAPFSGHREQHINIVNHTGEENIPLYVQFLGSNTILNDPKYFEDNSEVKSNELTLRITNILNREEFNAERTKIKFSKESRFVIRFDAQDVNEDKPWALGKTDEVAAIEMDGWGRNIGTVTRVIRDNSGQARLAIDDLQESLPVGTRLQIGTDWEEGGAIFTVTLEQVPLTSLQALFPIVPAGENVTFPVEGDENDIAQLKADQHLLLWDVKDVDPDANNGQVNGTPKAPSLNWAIRKNIQANPPVWEITPPDDRLVALAAGEHIQFKIKKIQSSLRTGQANLYFQYQNIPGYWDGQFVCTIEKSPIIFRKKLVGVGLADPKAKLHVDGDLKVSDKIFVGNGTPSPETKLEVNGDAKLTGTLAVDGNVGIGTTSTNAKLTIKPDKSGRGIDVLSPSAGNTHFPYSNNWNYISGKGVIFRNVAHKEKMRIDNSTGNVGIGTAAPRRNLHIENGGQISLQQSGTIATTSRAGIYWHSNNEYGIYRTPGAWIHNTYQQLKLDWQTGIILKPGTGNNKGHDKSYVEITGGKGLRVMQGNVGIGTTSTKAKLTIKPDKNGRGIDVLSPSAGNTHLPYSNNWNYISGKGVIFRDVADKEKMRIDSSTGNVGIGTTKPGNYKLSVAGGSVLFSHSLDVRGGLLVRSVPVWDGTNDNDLTWNGSRITREGSSRRYKKNIKTLTDDFSKILRLEPKQYEMKKKYGGTGVLNFGYIAEELDDLGLRNLVTYNESGQPDGIKYKKICIYLLEVVKDLNEKIERLYRSQESGD